MFLFSTAAMRSGMVDSGAGKGTIQGSHQAVCNPGGSPCPAPGRGSKRSKIASHPPRSWASPRPIT